jgi:hypothetical protein
MTAKVVHCNGARLSGWPSAQEGAETIPRDGVVAAAHGDFLFGAIFGAASAMTIIEAIRHLR